MQRRKARAQKTSTKPVSKQEISLNTSKTSKWLFLSFIFILTGVCVYLLLPADYTGPKYADSERAAEKRSKETLKEKSFSQSGTDLDEEGKRLIANSSSCNELMDKARKLINSSSEDTSDRIELALDMLATCALKEPNNAAARWNIAAALLQAQRVKEALPFINEALTLDPTNKNYLYDAGVLLGKLGLHKESVKCLEKYLEVVLGAPNWEHMLATLSIQREDEWEFLYEAGTDIVDTLELLLNSYLHETSLIKAGYLYKLVIGLKGLENAGDLIQKFAFFSFGLGDLANGIGYLQYNTEREYVSFGYGQQDRAREIVIAHALRLFTSGIDAHILSIVRNLLMSGKPVWDELVYHCDLGDDVSVQYTETVFLSDIKHILTKCLISQQIIPKLIENGASVHAENIFGWTPLLQIISLDSPTVLHQILQAKGDPQSRTAIGLTSLHVASIKGSGQVILPLIQAGLKPEVKDSFNRTALGLACLHRWSLNIITTALKRQPPSGCPIKPQYLAPLKEGFKTGGWLTSTITLPTELTKEQCDIDVIGYDAKVEELLVDYLTIQRPVLIRNATNNGALKKLFQTWQRKKLDKEYGHLVFNEVLVPYAEAFGYNYTKTTLSAFLNKMTKLQEDRSQTHDVFDLPPPTYIFESIPVNSPLLEHFKIPAILDPSLTEISSVKTQFYVGGALSGAPPHFHRSAWNVLIYGKKRWFLFPPKDAFYSKQHVWQWWKDKYRNGPKTWECVQHPGDMIVLPDMWGHAVINLKESVGVASEFVYGASEFSL